MNELIIKAAVGIVVLCILGVIGFIVGHGSRVVADRNVTVIGYNAKTRAAGVLGCLLGLGMMVALAFTPPANNDRDWWGAIGVAAGFIGLGVLLMLEGFKTKLVITPNGIGKFSWHSRPKFIAWDEIEKVYLGQLSEFVVRSLDGKKMGVGTGLTMANFEWFVAACRTHLPSEKFPEEFRAPRDGQST